MGAGIIDEGSRYGVFWSLHNGMTYGQGTAGSVDLFDPGAGVAPEIYVTPEGSLMMLVPGVPADRVVPGSTELIILGRLQREDGGPVEELGQTLVLPELMPAGEFPASDWELLIFDDSP